LLEKENALLREPRGHGKKKGISYLSAVNESMLVSFDSRTFRIQAIADPDERKAELRKLCLETGQKGRRSLRIPNQPSPRALVQTYAGTREDEIPLPLSPE
jgi:hypothetical protein